MKIPVGEKIRELRQKRDWTQAELAAALDVSAQAVSRWEMSVTYPDLELLPSIANLFGVTIDALFGCHADRERKVAEIIARVEAFGIQGRSDDGWVEECLTLLRNGLMEFPQNEKLLITLAQTLSDAGWRRYREWLFYDEEGFLQHDHDRHRSNEYWLEAVQICEKLMETASDHSIVNRAVGIAVLLYRNLGETQKAIDCASRMPSLRQSRELLMAAAADGKQAERFIGEALLQMARSFADHVVYGVMNNLHHFESDWPIVKLQGAISVFHLLCDDGNLGSSHGELIKLYLYLSRIQWERGYQDEAFASLEQALQHARALDRLGENVLTAPLVKGVQDGRSSSGNAAALLPQDWPWWRQPDCKQVAREMQADPRWAAWVARTQA